jgi:hypothetical protein
MTKLTIAMVLFCFLLGCSKRVPVAVENYNEKTIITGVWSVEEFARRYPHPDSAWTIIKQQNESLYLFSNKYYAYSYVRGTSPRKLFEGDPNRPSDAEKMAAYDSFVANMGTYFLKDSILTLTAVLNKNPNEMVGRSLIYRAKIERNKIEMTTTDPPFLPGREWKTILSRIE